MNALITSHDELVDPIIDMMSELSLELPEIPCFGIADWQKFYGITLTPKQIDSVGDFPWSDALLNGPCPFYEGKMIRETHFAFVGLDSISIMELQKLNPKTTEPRFKLYGGDAWFANEHFATNVTLKFRWYLALITIVPNSENKTFDEQEAMLPEEYEVPSALEETAKDFLYFKRTGVYANQNRFARTSTLVSRNFRVHVGLCKADSIYVDPWIDVDPYDHIGVSAFRTIEPSHDLPC